MGGRPLRSTTVPRGSGASQPGPADARVPDALAPEAAARRRDGRCACARHARRRRRAAGMPTRKNGRNGSALLGEGWISGTPTVLQDPGHPTSLTASTQQDPGHPAGSRTPTVASCFQQDPGHPPSLPASTHRTSPTGRRRSVRLARASPAVHAAQAVTCSPAADLAGPHSRASASFQPISCLQSQKMRRNRGLCINLEPVSEHWRKSLTGLANFVPESC